MSMLQLCPPLVGRVHCMDALELMRLIPAQSVDLVLTDPPYGLGGRVFDFPHKHYSAINEEWDHFAPTDWMRECKRVLKPGGSVVCFGGRQSIYTFAAEGFRLKWRLVNDITWEKPDAPPNFTGRMMTESTERALWFCPTGKDWTYNLETAKSMNLGINLRDVWRFPIEHTDRVHPAQKPLRLFERCIELFTSQNDIVLDPFMGSGTTAVAARNLNRRWIVGDRSADYCAMAEKRLSQAYTPNMFEVMAQVSTR